MPEQPHREECKVREVGPIWPGPEPRAAVDELLGADPDWCGGRSVDEYMDEQRQDRYPDAPECLDWLADHQGADDYYGADDDQDDDYDREIGPVWPTVWPFPEEVTSVTGLTSWPERGSDQAPAFAMAWKHAKRTVTIAYESDDALWRVTELDGRSDPPRTVSTDLYPRAETAYLAALDIIVTPLP